MSSAYFILSACKERVGRQSQQGHEGGVSEEGLSILPSFVNTCVTYVNKKEGMGLRCRVVMAA